MGRLANVVEEVVVVDVFSTSTVFWAPCHEDPPIARIPSQTRDLACPVVAEEVGR